MKIEKAERQETLYPSKKWIASLALGVTLSTTACTGTTKPKPPDTTQKQIEEPEVLGGIPPIEPPPSQKNTPPTTPCDVNLSKPNQIKYPTALAGKIVAPKR